MSGSYFPSKGTIAPDGKAQLTILTFDVAATASDGHLVGTWIGVACDYDFDLPRDH